MRAVSRRVLPLLTAAAALTVTGCSGSGTGTTAAPELTEPVTTTAPEPVTRTVAGELVLSDGEAFSATTGVCDGGHGGYEDLSTGSQVFLKDGSGDLLGVGEFGVGSGDGRGGCRLPFSIDDVPDADFYEVTTQSRRPGRVVPAAELASENWQVALQVGDPDEAAYYSSADCLPRDDFSVEWKSPKIVKLEGRNKFGFYRYRVSGALHVTNHGDVDATTTVDWSVRAPSADYGGMRLDTSGFQLVDVEAGGTVTHPFSTANFSTSTAMERDLSRAVFKQPRVDAHAMGTRGGMGC